MKLHQNPQLFKTAVLAVAGGFNIPAIYIEKDYWVTYALRAVFSHPIGQDTVFKGGRPK